jgi:hypothetical protein
VMVSQSRRHASDLVIVICIPDRKYTAVYHESTDASRAS